MGEYAVPMMFKVEVEKSDIHRNFASGVASADVVEDRRGMFGPCIIDVPVKGVVRLLVEEVLNPFYIFQAFSIALWMWDGYRYYASAIFVTSAISAIISLIETRRNLLNAKEMAHYECPMTVIRNNVREEKSSRELVPGDLMVVPDGIKLPCDAILIQGDCVTNESMLTGESVPVLKDALPNVSGAPYSFNDDKRHSLFEGTMVLQTRNDAIAIVSRTGFMTMKGKLVRSILYPKPN
jgi:magnesium-transporting ATPase (P-type)